MSIWGLNLITVLDLSAEMAFTMALELYIDSTRMHELPVFKKQHQFSSSKNDKNKAPILFFLEYFNVVESLKDYLVK